jgi:hypothetical protein
MHGEPAGSLALYVDDLLLTISDLEERVAALIATQHALLDLWEGTPESVGPARELVTVEAARSALELASAPRRSVTT